ncbi:MAG: hypothetical protein WBS21_27470 [Candidatus Acidiferrum sp.]
MYNRPVPWPIPAEPVSFSGVLPVLGSFHLLSQLSPTFGLAAGIAEKLNTIADEFLPHFFVDLRVANHSEIGQASQYKRYLQKTRLCDSS